MIFLCLFAFLTSSSATRLCRGRVPRLTSDNLTCCHTQDRAGRHDFCLSRSHYTDTNPTSREWVVTVGICAPLHLLRSKHLEQGKYRENGLNNIMTLHRKIDWGTERNKGPVSTKRRNCQHKKAWILTMGFGVDWLRQKGLWGVELPQTSQRKKKGLVYFAVSSPPKGVLPV